MVLSVGIASLMIFMFAMLMVVSSLLYKKRMNVKYNIKNMFPFEFTYKSKISENFYTYAFLTLFVLSAIAFFATFDRTYRDGYNIFTMIGGILTSIALFAMFIIPLTNLRLHMIFSVVFYVLNFATTGSNTIHAWKVNSLYSSVLAIIAIVLGIIIAVSQLVLFLNPRMTLDFKAEKVEGENGEVTYVRPKWVVYAFTEWMHIFLFILNIVNITILTFAK